ncbi:nuclear transport factor 2 family protein [Micromonospora sp. 15K316]|uniref:nuclear transport factor 2 family protein n=1 Tax=Micromonospora sp. 15K316 TaxID=2530376 RepID=UPI00104CD591|nr:nuclear transport factor 2 family protein [Micromonospora sp. 15K316]TDC38562.1 nuclear transport factor 2 family protein [Micromonospora sp. 15K316]
MPDSELEAALLDAERRLQAAQRAGDVVALDELLDDHLIAIGPDGGRFTKQDDLVAHHSGTSVIDELVEEQVELLVEGFTGVTFFVGRVAGRFGGSPFEARLRYTRTWVYDGEGDWRLLAAHIGPA